MMGCFLAGASLTLQGVTIQNGSDVDQGGGIRNAGRLEIQHTAVTSNSSKEGGGIYNAGHIALRAWGLSAGLDHGMRVASALGGPVLRRGVAPAIAPEPFKSEDEPPISQR